MSTPLPTHRPQPNRSTVTPLTVVRDIHSAPSLRSDQAQHLTTAAGDDTNTVITLTKSEFFARREELLELNPDQSTHCPTSSKTAFATASAAQRHLHNAWRKGRPGMALPTRHYACPCGYWHLTSHPIDDIPQHHRLVVVDDNADTAPLADVIDLQVYAESVTPIARARAMERAKAWQRRRDGSRHTRIRN